MMRAPIIGSSLLLVLVAASSYAGAETVSKSEQREGFVPLFNGKNLDGWWIRNGDTGFDIANGALISTGEEGGGDWLFTNEEFQNFVLRYEYRVQPEGQGNSGVAIRATKDGNPAFSGMEIQIIRPGWPVEWQRAGALYSTVPPKVQADNPAGEWNSVEILCDGPRVRTEMNGHELYDVRITEYNETKDSQKKLTDRVKKGHIALQNHGDRVEFRNIRLKRLPEGWE